MISTAGAKGWSTLRSKLMVCSTSRSSSSTRSRSAAGGGGAAARRPPGVRAAALSLLRRWQHSSTAESLRGDSSVLAARKRQATAISKRSCRVRDCLAKKRWKKTSAVAVVTLGSLRRRPASSRNRHVFLRWLRSSSHERPSRTCEGSSFGSKGAGIIQTASSRKMPPLPPPAGDGDLGGERPPYAEADGGEAGGGGREEAV